MSNRLAVRVELPYVTGLTADLAVNSFNCWYTGAIDPLDAVPLIIGGVASMYNDAVGAGQSIGYYLSTIVSRATDACVIKVYNPPSALGPLGDPVSITNFTLHAAITSGVNLPSEVALCGSYKGTALTGGAIPIRSRHGRMYFGPVRSQTDVEDADHHPAPSLGFMEAVLNGVALLTAACSTAGAPMIVWSQTHGGGVFADHLWVDNEWDTQRRRGTKATSRVHLP